MHQVMKVAGMEDLPIIWSCLDTKVAPFIAELFCGVHDSNSVVRNPVLSNGLKTVSVWDILSNLKEPLKKGRYFLIVNNYILSLLIKAEFQ